MSFYELVPKSIPGNLLFRREIVRRGCEDREFGDTLNEMCRKDLLFFINAFGWLIEPRREGADSKVIPFVTWPMQDRALEKSLRAINGQRDIVIEKSRDLGATWMYLYLFTWEFLYKDRCLFGLVSRNREASANFEDPDSLLSKIGEILEHLPPFIVRSTDYEKRASGSFRNLRTKSSIVAYSTTSDIARGGRKRAILLDEFHSFKPGQDYMALSSSQHATPCRILLSTLNPKMGPMGAYYDEVEKCRLGQSVAEHIVLDWREHPSRSKGLYTSTDGVLKIIDKEYKFPEDYQFVLDGRVRSPYYDYECKRPGATTYSIAAELDREFEGTTATFFDIPTLDIQKQEMVRPPLYEGRMEYHDPYRPKFRKRKGGEWRIWCPLDHKMMPPKGRYSVGVDISAGSGGAYSSYSAIAVFNVDTGEMVASYRCNTIKPHQLAALAVSCCNFFSDRSGDGALHVPEVNGPLGTLYRDVILDLHYTNNYRSEQGKKAFRSKGHSFGMHNNDAGEKILGLLQRDMDSGYCVLRDELVFGELRQYVYHNGRVVHRAERVTEDEAGKGKAHGDLAIATACAWLGVRDLEPDRLADLEEREEELDGFLEYPEPPKEYDEELVFF